MYVGAVHAEAMGGHMVDRTCESEQVGLDVLGLTDE